MYTGVAMRFLLAVSILFTVFTPLMAAAPNTTDDTAVRVLVQKYVQARDEQSRSAVESLFTADADQLVSSGEWRKGRDAVVRGSMASTRRTGGTRSITVQSVRFLSPDVAIADGRYDLSGLTGGKTRHMWTSIVAVRVNDGWKIAAIRNMLPAAPAPAR
jgi:uncharacterized protein (TIGR02246 family)